MGIGTLSWTERGGDGEPGSQSAMPLSVARHELAAGAIAVSSTTNQSGDWYVKATPAIDPLLERHPTRSKAPAAWP
jgi:hypothetical protein